MGAIVETQTGNFLKVNYDVKKIFVWDNHFKPGTFLNNSGAEATFVPGTLIGRVAATDKLVILDAGAADGSQYPVGILQTYVNALADAGEVDVEICISGDVVKSFLVFDDTDTLETIVDLRRLKDRINSDTMGINLVEGDDLTA